VYKRQEVRRVEEINPLVEKLNGIPGYDISVKYSKGKSINLKLVFSPTENKK